MEESLLKSFLIRICYITPKDTYKHTYTHIIYVYIIYYIIYIIYIYVIYIYINIIHRLKKEFHLIIQQNQFNESKEIYQKAPEKSGYWETFKYRSANENINNNKRNRKRNVIWLNPPFDVYVKTKVGNYFLNLIRKHFSLRHKFSKVVNLTPSK